MAFSTDENVLLNKNKWIIFFIICMSVFFTFDLGNRKLAVPDEARYVEISREMSESNDFVTSRLNGVKYFEKPPLFYWIEAINIKLAGIDFGALRFPVAIFAILGCLFLLFASLQLYDFRCAVLSASVLATSLLYFVHSRFINLDLGLSVFMSGALWCYFLAFVRPCSLNRKLLITLFYLFCALAVLVKGLVGIVLPGLVIMFWIIFNGSNLREKLSIVGQSLYFPGVLLFFIVAAPWHILCATRNSYFSYYYFIYEHFVRFATLSHNRYYPFWFFVPVLIAGLLPWTGFCFYAIKDAFKKRGSENVFLLSWILSIFVFFSCSNSKLIPYILPIFPAIAFLTGRFLVECTNNVDYKSNLAFKKNPIQISFYITFFIILCLISFGVYSRHLISEIIAYKGCKILINSLCALLCVSAIGWEILSYFIYKSKRSQITLLVFHVCVSAGIMVIVNNIMPCYQEIKKPSTYDISKSILYNLVGDVDVFCYNEYFQDLPLYLGRTVGVVNPFGELRFWNDLENEPNKDIIDDIEFFDRFTSPKRRVFVCMRRKEYGKFVDKFKCEHKILDINKDFITVVNR